MGSLRSGTRSTVGALIAAVGVFCLAGCIPQADTVVAPIVDPSPISTPPEPDPVPWEDHDTSVSCDGAVATDEYGHYGWTYNADANEWVQDDEPTVDRALSSLSPLTPEQRAELACP